LARDARALVDVCTWPSEAFWRVYELHVLREVAFENPIFELGCGDGSFTELLGLEVEDGIDLNRRAARVGPLSAGNDCAGPLSATL
jgi:hypothetical protein